MRFFFLVLLTSTIGVSSCNDSIKVSDKSDASNNDSTKTDTDDEDDSDSSYVNASPLSEGDARKMINQWLALPKNTDNVIQQITLDGERLRPFIKKTDYIKMYMAAYTMPVKGHSKNEATVIISRVKKGSREYYDINDLFPPVVSARAQKPPPLCPPPTGCDFPLTSLSSDSVGKH